MKELKLWQFMLEQVLQQKMVVFMCVVESSGSSPGRKGFKMAVTEKEMYGSIGGGIMEHKFVELCKDTIRQNAEEVLVKQQKHSKSASANQSGMICSGEQSIAVYTLKSSDTVVIKKIVDTLKASEPVTFEFSSEGFSLIDNDKLTPPIIFEKQSETQWKYVERIDYKYHLHIVGGGHVSLALSKLMRDLNFYISVYDDREELNTIQQNSYAHTKFHVNYERINELIPDGSDFVVIMTFGYRSDSIVLRKLLRKKFRYLGLLGSKSKIEKMLTELRNEEVEEELIQSVHAPVGIQINSQTPEEIAVSIAAEIIKLKNS